MLQRTEPQERLEEVVVAVVEGNVNFAVARLVPDAVLQQPAAVLARLCELVVGAAPGELMHRERAIPLAILARNER